MAEFWNVCTRPKERNGFGMTIGETENNARKIELGFLFLADNENVYREWRRIVREQSVAGVQVHDARLVASMHTHGLTHILTFNASDFQRFPGIVAVTPESVPQVKR